MNITVRYIQELQRKRAELYGKVEKLDVAIKMLTELNGEAPIVHEQEEKPVKRAYKRRIPVGAALKDTILSKAFYHAKAVELIKAKGRPVSTAEIAEACLKAGIDDTPGRMATRVYASLYVDDELVRVKGTGKSISWALNNAQGAA